MRSWRYCLVCGQHNSTPHTCSDWRGSSTVREWAGVITAVLGGLVAFGIAGWLT